MPELRPGEGAPSGAIAVGTEISPLDPFQLKRAGLIGIATDSGGKTSHAAILARALGLPYVAGVQHLTGRIRRGDTVPTSRRRQRSVAPGTDRNVSVDCR